MRRWGQLTYHGHNRKSWEGALRGFRPLFYTGSIIQLITAPIHLYGALQKQVPSNDREKTLLDLLYNYRIDLGAGFVRSLGDFFMGFNLLYAVLIFFLGLINLFAIRQAGDWRFLRTLCWLNVVSMGASTVIALKFFFLPPLLFCLVPCLAFCGAALTARRPA